MTLMSGVIIFGMLKLSLLWKFQNKFNHYFIAKHPNIGIKSWSINL